MKKTPYKQGILDGMCGYYSVINACHYLKPNFYTKRAEKSMQKLVKNFSWKTYAEGMRYPELKNVLDSALKRDLNFKGLYYFEYKDRIEPKKPIDFISSLLAATHSGKQVAIVSIGYPWYHWTVITKVDVYKKRLHLFDSYCFGDYVDFSEVSFKREKDKRQFMPFETIIVGKK